MTKWTVTEKESGSKLIAFIKEKLGEQFSSRQIKKAIEDNLCEVNGRVERFASTQLGTGDRIVLRLEIQKKEKALPKEKKSSRILYEDNDLFIYNKPAGVSSEGKELAEFGFELVHRLDRDTTGALIFAKSVQMRDKMFEIFRQQQISKTYLAIVDGIPSKKSGVIENYLGKIHEYQGQKLWGSVKQDVGQYAYTEWKLESKGKDSSLLECFPKTGRTHQIRVHLSEMGHPILGDYQYGRKFACKYRPGRYLLHASSVTFNHPTSGEEVTVSAPLPPDFQEALKALGIKG